MKWWLFTYQFGLHSSLVSTTDSHAEDTKGESKLGTQCNQYDRFPEGV